MVIHSIGYYEDLINIAHTEGIENTWQILAY